MKSLSSVASPLAALFLISPSVLADQRHITNYQPGFTEEAEPEIIVEVEKDTLQLLLDAFNVKN